MVELTPEEILKMLCSADKDSVKLGISFMETNEDPVFFLIKLWRKKMSNFKNDFLPKFKTASQDQKRYFFKYLERGGPLEWN